ncbi:MAG: hypothetical protein ACRD4Y_06910, partial [Candidatus Acidiferrales bacterium]
FRGASRGVAALLGLPPEIAGKSWRGPSLDILAVQNAVRDAGGTVAEMTEPGTPMTWCRGTKSRAQIL